MLIIPRAFFILEQPTESPTQHADTRLLSTVYDDLLKQQLVNRQAWSIANIF